MAVVVSFVLLDSQPAEAGEADAFPSPHQKHRTRPQKPGFFGGEPKTPGSGSGSGPGKPNDNDNSCISYSKPESIEETKKHLSSMDKYIQKLEEVTDSESESESESEDNEYGIELPGRFDVDFEYELDKNGKPILIVQTRDGTIRRVEFEQTRDKYYHEDIFANATPPAGFNNKDVRGKDYFDRLAYLRTNIPDENVIQLQNEIGKHLADPNTFSKPAVLGKRKIKGTIDINIKTGIVSFTDAKNNRHRTVIKMTPKRIDKLKKDKYHLFPNK